MVKVIFLKNLWSKFRRKKRANITHYNENNVKELKNTAPSQWYKMLKKMGGLEIQAGKLEIESLKGLTDSQCAEAVAESFAAVSQQYQRLDRCQLPAFLPAGRPEQVNVFQVMHHIKKLGSTKSTLPIDIPDRLRKECALDLAEPLTDIINSCLTAGKFPIAWRKEWVTPVPKIDGPLKTVKDVRKIASTSDYAKICESILRTWIVEDIGEKININQFAGKKGVGTEHLMVLMVDRVQSLLDRPGMSAVVLAAVDWMGAFDRQDPTKTAIKIINMGLRPSLVPVILDFLEDRSMVVKFNSAISKWYDLVGGSPQGSWNGQNSYIVSSDDNADGVPQDDQYKYCDDLSILELVMLGSLLTEYNFYEHVASDVGIDQKFLSPQHLSTQYNLDQIALWTRNNLMRLNENKTSYIVFTRARQSFATRLTLNSNLLERKNSIKLLGMTLQEDGGWEENTRDLCKKAYARISLLTKLKYSGTSIEDLVHVYKMYIRSRLEYNSVVFHSSLTQEQSKKLDRCEAVCLKIILQEMFVSHSAACEMLGIRKLSLRRETRCLNFSKKCLKHPQNKRFFPLNPNIQNNLNVRNREPYKVNFCYTETYRKSTIPYCQRLLNSEAAADSAADQ